MNIYIKPFFLNLIRLSEILVLVLLLANCKPDIEPKDPDDDDEPIENPTDTTKIVTDYLYDIDALPTIYLEISETEWNNLLSYFDQNNHNEENVHADVKYLKGNDTFALADIGLRLNGLRTMQCIVAKFTVTTCSNALVYGLLLYQAIVGFI